MKQINFTCTIQMDVHDEDSITMLPEHITTEKNLAIVKEAVEIINRVLQQTGLMCSPQILPYSMKIERVVENVQCDEPVDSKMTMFELLIGKYECREFADVDPDVSGVEVYNESGGRIGSMIGISLPDPDDEEAVQKFKNELTDWLIDNEF